MFQIQLKVSEGNWPPFTGSINLTICNATFEENFTFQNIILRPNSQHEIKNRVNFTLDHIENVTLTYKPLDPLAVEKGIQLGDVNLIAGDTFEDGYERTDVYCVKHRGLLEPGKKYPVVWALYAQGYC